MNENLSKLMKIAHNHPEPELLDDIWCAIQNKQIKSLKMKSTFYGIFSLLSLGGFVFVLNILRTEFLSSGFTEYVSLAFSDGGLLALYWKEYLLSLSDSIPYASLGVALFLLFSTLVSVRKFVYQYRNKLLIN